MPKLTSVPESFTLGGSDQTVIVIATQAGEGFREWVDRVLAERLAVAAKIVKPIGGYRLVAVLRAHPSRVTDIVESSGSEVDDLIALPADSLP